MGEVGAKRRGVANACPGGGERGDKGEGEPEPAAGRKAAAADVGAAGIARFVGWHCVDAYYRDDTQ